jgi:hypothetical protein
MTFTCGGEEPSNVVRWKDDENGGRKRIIFQLFWPIAESVEKRSVASYLGRTHQVIQSPSYNGSSDPEFLKKMKVRTEMTSSGAPLTIWKSFKIKPDGTLLATSDEHVASLVFVSTLIVYDSNKCVR